MDRSKIVAIVTGAIALILSIAYLLVVQFLDLRGEMIPAPQDLSNQVDTQSSVLPSEHFANSPQSSLLARSRHPGAGRI